MKLRAEENNGSEIRKTLPWSKARLSSVLIPSSDRDRQHVLTGFRADTEQWLPCILTFFLLHVSVYWGFPALSHHFKIVFVSRRWTVLSPCVPESRGDTSKELLQRSSPLHLSQIQDRDCGCQAWCHDQVRLWGSSAGMCPLQERRELHWPEGKWGQMVCKDGP